MATITIKDLTDSVELDREAMTAILGGARLRGRQTLAGSALQRSRRIVDYPPGFRTVTAKPGGKPAK